MKNSNRKIIIILLLFFIGFILSPSIAFQGATTGLVLWALKVLPALFPAMLITSCMMQLLPSESKFAYGYMILSGIFCGYPVGAFSCAQYHLSHPNETLCQKIMGYCNISGSAFVINYIYYHFMQSHIPLWKLMLIIYIPPILLLCIVLLRSFMQIKKEKSGSNLSKQSIKVTVPDKNPHQDFAEIFYIGVNTAVENSLKLGGYIVFFSCLSNYFIYIFSNHHMISVILCGITEITSGIQIISESMLSPMLTLILICAVNAFGGLSTIMQTFAVINKSGLSIKKYIYQKLLITTITIMTATALIYV
ncbi:MAG: hypothetical protein PHW47_13575 [Lachnospira sp.]|nr:hypothetical protein [Lachnospira sp.]